MSGRTLFIFDKFMKLWMKKVIVDCSKGGASAQRCKHVCLGQQYKIYGSTGIVLMLGIYGSPERG